MTTTGTGRAGDPTTQVPEGLLREVARDAGIQAFRDAWGEEPDAFGVSYLSRLSDAVLAALFDACEVREEWGCRLTWGDGHHEDTWLGERKYAQLRYDLHQQKRADNPGWRVTPTLIRRYVLTTPAEPVSSTGEEKTDG